MLKTSCAVAGHAYRLAADPANTALERDQPRSFSGRAHHGHPDHERPGAALQVNCSFVLRLSVVNSMSGGDMVCLCVSVSVALSVCVGVCQLMPDSACCPLAYMENSAALGTHEEQPMCARPGVPVSCRTAMQAYAVQSIHNITTEQISPVLVQLATTGPEVHAGAQSLLQLHAVSNNAFVAKP